MPVDKEFDEKRERIAIRKLLVENFPRERGSLLPALHFIQDEFGYLPAWALEVLGWHLGVPSSEVYGSSTSYAELNFEVSNGADIEVCEGVSCSVLGSNGLIKFLESLEEKTGNALSYKGVNCAFICSVGPVVKIKGKWIGKMDISELGKLIK